MVAHDQYKTKAALVAELETLRRYVASLDAGDGARESDERFRRLVQFLPESVRIVCDGAIVYANEEAARLYGAASADALIGRNADDLIPQDDTARIAEWRRSVLSLGTVPMSEQRRRRIDGEIVYVDATAMRIDWQGRPATLVISRDVTSRVLGRRAREQSERRLAAIAENMPGAAYECVVRPGGRIRFTYISAGVRELFGLDPEAVIARGTALLGRIHRDDRRAVAQAMRKPGRSPAPVEFEFRVQGAGGHTAWVRSIARPRGRQSGAIVWDGVLIDVTERSEALEALREAKETAEFANRSKSVFLANMSHELRTPLNAIMGFAEVIEREMFGAVGTPRYTEYAGDIRLSGEHLLDLINDILDLAKVEAGKLDLREEAVDVADVIESSVALLKRRAEVGQIRLAVRIANKLPRLCADETKIRQVLLNLLSNALKYTPAGGRVSVTASVGRKGDLNISVVDTGIGIDPEDVPTVLTPFGQVENAENRDTRGTGLGLPLAKSLVERHGGALSLHSQPGKGTTITVRFPPVRLVA